MKQLKLTEAAAADLDDIAVRIAENDIDTALRVVDELRERMLILRTSPQMGRKGSEEGTRELVVGSYVIPYRVRGSVVEILRVWHGRQRWWG